MIRYPVPSGGVQALVAAHDPTWAARAAARASAIGQAGRFNEKSSIWGEVKLVYMRLQHFKCAFCERPLAREQVGSIEHDLEHFRPKGAVRLWPRVKRGQAARTYPFSTGQAHASGYFWLAYEIGNYAASCKPCNTILKSDHFPIAGHRGASGAAIHVLDRTEKPFLVYPIGDGDDDPERLIAFDGIVAQAAARSGHRRRRAEVTIDFFQLNTREELRHGRFHVLRSMFTAYDVAQVHPDPARKAAALRSLDEAVAVTAPYAACARSFRHLLVSDPGKAWEIYLAAEAYLKR